MCLLEQHIPQLLAPAASEMHQHTVQGHTGHSCGPSPQHLTTQPWSNTICLLCLSLLLLLVLLLLLLVSSPCGCLGSPFATCKIRGFQQVLSKDHAQQQGCARVQAVSHTEHSLTHKPPRPISNLLTGVQGMLCQQCAQRAVQHTTTFDATLLATASRWCWSRQIRVGNCCCIRCSRCQTKEETESLRCKRAHVGGACIAQPRAHTQHSGQVGQ
mmetsp:Transcript_18851/g.52804  ORF Transcript_18851/g.52804 Transcript_18851/m.52804 type:complete len:214 (-) Transcript_18851:611-1252(-)